MEQYITLGNGKNYEVSVCGVSEGNLWIHLVGGDFMSAVSTFSNADNTANIEYCFGLLREQIEGYTVLRAVQSDYYGNIVVCLKRP